MVYFIIALIAGATVTSARFINSSLGARLGMLQSTFYNYLVGLTISVLFWLISKEGFPMISYLSIPWWAYLGGIMGIGVVTTSSIIAQKVSAFYLTLTIFCGQLFTGLIIDKLFSDNFSIGKLLGGLFVLIGLIYNLMVDNKKMERE